MKRVKEKQIQVTETDSFRWHKPHCYVPGVSQEASLSGCSRHEMFSLKPFRIIWSPGSSQK